MGQNAHDKRREAAYCASLRYMDLETALARISDVYRVERQQPVWLQEIGKYWMSPGNFRYREIVRRLEDFGLLERIDKDGRTYGMVSDFALPILLDEDEESEDRRNAIRQTALRPDLHSRLWELYHHKLPAIAPLRMKLMRDEKCSQEVADAMITGYRQTLKFASILGGGPDTDQDADEESDVPASTSRVNGSVLIEAPMIGEPMRNQITFRPEPESDGERPGPGKLLWQFSINNYEHAWVVACPKHDLEEADRSYINALVHNFLNMSNRRS